MPSSSRSNLAHLLSTRPGHVPVHFRPHIQARCLGLDKKKYLVSPDQLVGQLSYILMRRMPELRPDETLVLLSAGDRRLLSHSDRMDTVARRHADEEGIVHVEYVAQAAFG